jgi:hypothetical protein
VTVLLLIAIVGTAFVCAIGVWTLLVGTDERERDQREEVRR